MRAVLAILPLILLSDCANPWTKVPEAELPNVKVTYLPSMIRVDGTGTFEVNYDEISEALGYDSGYFDAAEFEENMSTHYGRMIHLDDKTIMFANPEDAADYLGFDLTARS